MRDPQALASAIKELRGKRTQRQVAKRAGIDPATWCAYEKGARWPRSNRRFELIALGLQVQVSDLDLRIFEHQRRRLEVTALHPEAKPREMERTGQEVAMDLLMDDRVKAHIGETVSRVTSDLIHLFAFVLVASQRQERS